MSQHLSNAYLRKEARNLALIRVVCVRLPIKDDWAQEANRIVNADNRQGLRGS